MPVATPNRFSYDARAESARALLADDSAAAVSEQPSSPLCSNNHEEEPSMGNHEAAVRDLRLALRKSTGANHHLRPSFTGGNRKTVEFIDMEEIGIHSDSEKDSKLWRSKFASSLFGSRAHQPRMSLLGKPLAYRIYKQDAKYRRMQCKIYNFLERPRGCQAASYHVLVLLAVLLCLALSVFQTIPDYQDDAGSVLYHLEFVLVVWFSLEYLTRMWSAGCRSRYQGWQGRIRFASSPFCIIDIVVIVASVVVLCMGSTGQVFAASAIRGLRFFQILRMVRIDRRGGTWKLLGSVVWAHRQELITTMYIGFLGLIFASFLVYMCEKDQPNSKFQTYADALWWGVITLCTVGYGDKVPETWLGKIVASFCALLGISFFALPAGILGSGFALKVQQQQRQKHIIRRRIPAASLIQSLWRLYCSDEQSRSLATWKIHCKPLPELATDGLFRARTGTLPAFRKLTQSRLVTLISTNVQRGYDHITAPKPDGSPQQMRSANLRFRNSTTGQSFVSRFSRKSLRRSQPSIKRPLDVTMSDTSTIASRGGSIRDHFSTHKPPSDTALPTMAARKETKGSLTLLMGPTANDDDNNHNKLPLSGAAPGASADFCADDDTLRIHSVAQLTQPYRNAIRFIRRCRYLVSRRKFKEALKPYDVKDVIEQYSAGHVDLLARVKLMQSRLDSIIGRSDQDIFDSKVSITSRVIKIERQVESVEGKLDWFIELYLKDRIRNASGLSLTPINPTSIENSCCGSPDLLELPKSILTRPRAGSADVDAMRTSLSCSGELIPYESPMKAKKRVTLCHSAEPDMAVPASSSQFSLGPRLSEPLITAISSENISSARPTVPQQNPPESKQDFLNLSAVQETDETTLIDAESTRHQHGTIIETSKLEYL